MDKIRDQIDKKLLKYKDLIYSKWQNTVTNLTDW
jgi:hypothetical protein